MKDNQKRSRDGIPLHGPKAFDAMRAAGRLAAQTLDYITPFVVPGAVTQDLDQLIHDFTIKNGAIPATLGYKGYPKSCCISVNEVVCHGIPGAWALKDGDIVNIDVTCILDGWYGDTSRMFIVGNTSIKARRLIDVTYRSMMAGIEVVRPGATLGDIGYAIQKLAEKEHCSVVRDFCGHGLGQVFHDTPSILHYGDPGTGAVLEAGMLFTVEPMINLGGWQTKVKSDGWTAVTKDRSLSAQFEHTIGVTDTGYEIFTLSPQGLHQPPYAAS